MILQSNEIRIPIYIKNKLETTPIDVVQYLNSFYMYFEIKDFDIPNNSTAKFYLKKPSGKEVYQDLEIQGKQLVLIPTNQTFAETGVQNAQISITNGENIATSFSIQFAVHKNLVSLEATESRNEATIISQLEQFLIKPTAQGDNIILKDSSNYYINGIKLFGKSIQEGTPTPDTPVEIKSIQNKINLAVSNKNLFNKNNPQIETIFISNNGQNAGVTSFDRSILIDCKPNTTYTISFNTNIARFRMCSTSKKITEASIEVKGVKADNQSIATITAGENDIFLYINIGNSISDFQNIINNNNLMVEIGNIKSDYIVGENQTLTIPLSQNLNGLKVTKDGNYTDEKGQQWVTDSLEIYSDGTGKLIQRILEVNGNNFTKTSNLTSTTQYSYASEFNLLSENGLCTHLSTYLNDNSDTEHFYAEDKKIVLYLNNERNFEEIKNTLKVYVGLSKPIEKAMSKQQVNEILALKTYYPNTNISTLENAGVEINYFADVKNYVDEEVKKAVDNITQILRNTLSTLPLDVQSKMIENDIQNKFKGAVN